MRSKSLTRKALFAALFAAFAGTLFSQTVENKQQSAEAAPTLMASLTKLDTARYERPQVVVNKDTAAPSIGSLTTASTALEQMLAPAKFSAPKFNAMGVQEKGGERNSFVRVEPDLLPLSVRLDPTELASYGAAPAVVRVSFGRK